MRNNVLALPNYYALVRHTTSIGPPNTGPGTYDWAEAVVAVPKVHAVRRLARMCVRMQFSIQI